MEPAQFRQQRVEQDQVGGKFAGLCQCLPPVDSEGYLISLGFEELADGAGVLKIVLNQEDPTDGL